MKLFLKLLVFMLVLAVAAPFVLKDDAGRPLLDAGKLHMPELGKPPLPDLSRVGDMVDAARDKLEDKLARTGDEVRDEAAAVIYKWRDAQGNWHFTDSAPEGISSERLTIAPEDTNVVRLGGGTTTAAEQSSQTNMAGNPPSRFGRFVDRVQNVEDLARLQTQQRIMEEQGR